MEKAKGPRSASVQRPDKRLLRGGFAALYRKELTDHLRSTRFVIIFALLTLTSLASLYGALQGIMDAVSRSREFIFLQLFTASGNAIPSLGSFLAYLAPLAGLALGFDAINRERSQGTLNRLVSQPIHRDAVINAKFLSGVTIIFLMVFSLGILVGGIGLVSIGVPPSLEEIARVFVYLAYTGAYMSLWLSLSILFSVLCRHAATSALIVIFLWIFFTLFAGMLVTIIANIAYPTEGLQGLVNLVPNYGLQLGLNRVSPYYLYAEAVSTLLNPNVRTLGLVTQASLSGAIASYLSFDQSVLLVWPHLTSMVALVMASFTVAYVFFMKQEIRV